jgi:uncharacterized repeat protein (TIGR03847 family)
MARVIDLNPLNRITAGAIGKPGRRVFYVQGESDEQRISLVCEKQQIQALGVGLQEFLQELQVKYPDLLTPTGGFMDLDMELQEPIEPLFRVGQFALGYDEEADRVILVAQEAQEAADSESDDDDATESVGDDGATVRFWATRGQMMAMAAVGLEIAAKGRPLCGNCLQPMDPEGHFCPRRNGHKY